MILYNESKHNILPLVWKANLIYKFTRSVCLSVCDHWTQRKVTRKRQDDRRMESFRGPETQVLRARS